MKEMTTSNQSNEQTNGLQPMNDRRQGRRRREAEEAAQHRRRVGQLQAGGRGVQARDGPREERACQRRGQVRGRNRSDRSDRSPRP